MSTIPTKFKIQVFGYDVPTWITNAYRQIGVFAFGAAVQQLTTDIAKYSIGRFRPHFINVSSCFIHIFLFAWFGLLYITISFALLMLVMVRQNYNFRILSLPFFAQFTILVWVEHQRCTLLRPTHIYHFGECKNLCFLSCRCILNSMFWFKLNF